MSVEIKDDRRAWDGILRELAQLRRTKVTVGVHADDAQRDDGSSNAYIAAVHEFGKGRNPERSFLRDTVDSDSSIMHFAEDQAGAVAQGQMKAGQAGERIGIMVADKVKRRIRSGIPPALHESTIKRKLAKGSHGGGLASMASTPAVALIDTGQLINSITYEVKS